MEKKLFSPEETKKKFDALPQGVKDLLYSFEMTSIITKIGEKHALHIDQMDTLNNETAQVMLGLTDTSEFPEILVEDLGVDKELADAIARDINDLLFTKVREALKKPSAASVSVPLPPTDAPVAAPTPNTPATPVAAPILPVVAPEMHPADVMLTEKTVATMPTVTTPTPPTAVPKVAEQKVEPPKPTDYKADPYREPIS